MPWDVPTCGQLVVRTLYSYKQWSFSQLCKVNKSQSFGSTTYHGSQAFQLQNQYPTQSHAHNTPYTPSTIFLDDPICF